MMLEKGWINRQFARVERDARSWPDWMRRETELRQAEQKTIENQEPTTTPEKTAESTEGE